MSLNIPKGITSYASSIEVVIDTKSFGPRQRTAFATALHTGVIKGYGAPARVARVLRLAAREPYVHIVKHMIAWGNVPKNADAFYDGLTAVVVAERLGLAYSSSAWAQDNIDGLDILVQRRSRDGVVYGIGGGKGLSIAARVLKSFKFEREMPTFDRYVTLRVWDGCNEVRV